MDIFNRKKVKELEEELTRLRIEIIILQNEKSRLNTLFREAKKVQEVRHKTYTVDAVELVNELIKYPKKRTCGAGGCGFYHMIHSSVFAKVINAQP